MKVSMNKAVRVDKSKVLLSRAFIIVGLICAIVSVAIYWTHEEPFPYANQFPEIRAVLKKHASSPVRQTVYTLSAGAIQGEAILTPAPTVAVGRSIVDSQFAGVKGSYTKMRAPYTGQVTSHIDCSAKKFVEERPLMFNGIETPAILAVTGPRRIFGTCSLDQVKYASVFWSVYDSQKGQVLTIKLFKSVSDLDSINRAQQELFQLFQNLSKQQEDQ